MRVDGPVSSLDRLAVQQAKLGLVPADECQTTETVHRRSRGDLFATIEAKVSAEANA